MATSSLTRQPWRPSIHDYDLEEQEIDPYTDTSKPDYWSSRLPYRTRPVDYDVEGQFDSSRAKDRLSDRYACPRKAVERDYDRALGSCRAWDFSQYYRGRSYGLDPALPDNLSIWNPDKSSSRYVNNNDAWKEKRRAQANWARRTGGKTGFKLGISDSDDSDTDIVSKRRCRGRDLSRSRERVRPVVSSRFENENDHEQAKPLKELFEDSVLRDGMDPAEKGDLELLKLYRQRNDVCWDDNAIVKKVEPSEQKEVDIDPAFEYGDWHLVLPEELESSMVGEEDSWTFLDRE